MTVTVNCDMGEAFGLWSLGDDEALMPLISMANVACGYHAGDPMVMRATVAAAKAEGVQVGAHPSYPDLQGFGRRPMEMGAEELTACILYQAGALKAFLDEQDMPLSHLKPHGALYGRAARDEATANAIADAAEILGVPVLGMAGTQHEAVYAGRGIGFVAEYYVDLDYDDDGTVIVGRAATHRDLDQIDAKARRALVEGKTTSVSGTDIDVTVESLCVHSDLPNAPEVAARLRNLLDEWAAGTG